MWRLLPDCSKWYLPTYLGTYGNYDAGIFWRVEEDVNRYTFVGCSRRKSCVIKTSSSPTYLCTLLRSHHSDDGRLGWFLFDKKKSPRDKNWQTERHGKGETWNGRRIKLRKNFVCVWDMCELHHEMKHVLENALLHCIACMHEMQYRHRDHHRDSGAASISGWPLVWWWWGGEMRCWCIWYCNDTYCERDREERERERVVVVVVRQDIKLNLPKLPTDYYSLRHMYLSVHPPPPPLPPPLYKKNCQLQRQTIFSLFPVDHDVIRQASDRFL